MGEAELLANRYEAAIVRFLRGVSKGFRRDKIRRFAAHELTPEQMGKVLNVLRDRGLVEVCPISKRWLLTREADNSGGAADGAVSEKDC